jgi:serine/threonine-protein kinase
MVGEYPPVMASETDMDLPPGFQNGFDKYSNFRPMGKGGRADILACRDTALGRTVAMKQLQAKYADNSQLRRRFLREARLTAQLQHPNTVPVYEIGYQPDGELYFTMKKVAGRNLYQILVSLYKKEEDTVAEFPMDRLLDILIQVGYVLSYAHIHGVIHRDVKPENILVGLFGEVVLLDWGIARIWGMPNEDPSPGTAPEDYETLDGTGLRPGTPLYMSPEQVLCRIVDERSDIYSLGVVLYEMLTFSLPFQGPNVRSTFEKIVEESLQPPSERAPEQAIPAGLESICLRALEKDPAERFQSMRELIRAIREFRTRAMLSGDPGDPA